MFTPERYRDKASEYGSLVKIAADPDQKRELREREKSFIALADNEQWLADNHQNTIRGAEHDQDDGVALAQNEEQILRCLGGALIMQWNSLPRKLQRELFDNAGAMGELLETAELRGRIARFLHKHKNGEEAAE
jgi:hypothetical protein